MEYSLLVEVSKFNVVNAVLRCISQSVVNCGALEVPTQSLVTVADTVFGSVATYTCDTGYNLNGDDTRTCQADGTWSGVEPTCESKWIS